MGCAIPITLKAIGNNTEIIFLNVLEVSLIYPLKIIYERIRLCDLKQLYFIKVAAFYYKQKGDLQLLEHHYNTGT